VKYSIDHMKIVINWPVRFWIILIKDIILAKAMSSIKQEISCVRISKVKPITIEPIIILGIIWITFKFNHWCFRICTLYKWVVPIPKSIIIKPLEIVLVMKIWLFWKSFINPMKIMNPQPRIWNNQYNKFFLDMVN